MNNFSKDIAKVLFGFVLADMLVGIWLIATNALPMSFLGLEWSFGPVMIAILVEFVILILLAYYAWIRKPGQKQAETKEVEPENSFEEKA